MLINDNKRIVEIQREFQQMFPHLKLEFYTSAHEEGEGSPKKAMLSVNKRIGETRNVHAEGEMRISPEMSVETLERRFFEFFGLNAQVFRRSGNLWLQTTATDHWTLAEQDRKGGASEAYFEEMHAPEN